jgi:hypothetical protein
MVWFTRLTLGLRPPQRTMLGTRLPNRAKETGRNRSIAACGSHRPNVPAFAAKALTFEILA